MGFPSLVPQGPQLMDSSISAEIRGCGGPRPAIGHTGAMCHVCPQHSHWPTRPLPPGAWRWGVSTSSSNDRHRGWGHGARRQNSGGREGSSQAGEWSQGGGHEHRTCWGQESGTVCGEPTRPGAWVQGLRPPQALSWGCTLALGGLLSPPPSHWPVPSGQVPEWNVRCKRQGPPNRAPAQERIGHAQQGQHSPD